MSHHAFSGARTLILTKKIYALYKVNTSADAIDKYVFELIYNTAGGSCKRRQMYIGSRETIRVSGSLASSMRDTSSGRTRTGRMPHHVPLKASKRSRSRLVPRGLHSTIASCRDKILHWHPGGSHRWYIYASSSRS